MQAHGLTVLPLSYRAPPGVAWDRSGARLFGIVGRLPHRR